MKKVFDNFYMPLGRSWFFLFKLAGCKASDRISEDNNFSSLVGFKKTLNGVYIEN